MAMIDEIKEQSDKMRGQGLGAWLRWFWDYYRYITLGVIVGIAIVVSLIVNLVTRKEEAFSLIAVNFYGEGTAESDVWLAQELGEFLAIDPDRQEVSVDMQTLITPGQVTDQMEITTIQRIQAMVAAGDVDLLGADPYVFESYAISGMYLDLREVYSEEELAAFGDAVIYIDGADLEAARNDAESIAQGIRPQWQEGSILALTSKEEIFAAEARGVYTGQDPGAMTDPIPMGILMDDFPYFEEKSFNPQFGSVMGVVASTKHTEDAGRVLHYLCYGE